ncbi:hypothetical protein K661_01506 [Piscirickettsia salmonis LF-89 = ATCC VR-1361]|nr:hypothetical protein K661_01506 [Piscirickettsia salmonis LF-89 = ATCC VR-1361]
MKRIFSQPFKDSILMTTLMMVTLIYIKSLQFITAPGNSLALALRFFTPSV